MNSINPTRSLPVTGRVSGRHRRPVISSPSQSRAERDREALRQQIIHGSSPSPVRSGIGGVWGRVQEPTASPSSVLESGNRGVWGRVQEPTASPSSVLESGNRGVWGRVQEPTASPSSVLESGNRGVWGRVQEPTASPSSVLESGNRGVWGRVQEPTTSSQAQRRSVDNRELSALTFTFGDEVGNFFAETIKVGEGSIGTISKTEISLPPDYRSKELSWLGTFIYGATRIWQQHTGRYNSDARGAVYRHRQLRASNPGSEQHAEAVKQWFYVNYGDEYGLIGTDPHQMSLGRLRALILGGMDREVTPRSRLRSRTRGGDIADLQQIVNNRHGWIIDEIRDPSLLLWEIRRRGRTTPRPAILTGEDIMRGERPRIRYRTNDRMRRRSV